MVYFFHHYEMPYILHQERIQRIMNDVGSVPVMFTFFSLIKINKYAKTKDRNHKLRFFLKKMLL